MSTLQDNQQKSHPFADLLGINIDHKGEGECQCSVEFNESLLNPNDVVHGGVIYSLADTGMGGALQPMLSDGELCATIEIKITYLHAAKRREKLTCISSVIKKGGRVAMLESEISDSSGLIAKATGSFAVFKIN